MATVTSIVRSQKAKQFTSLDELLDYCWCRNFEHPQVAELAKMSGIAMSDGDFFEGYSNRQSRMEEIFRAAGSPSIITEHW